MSRSPKLRSQNPRLMLVLVIVFLIVIAGIVRVSLPLPALEAKLASSTIVLPGQLSVTFPEQGESAVGTDNLGVIAASSDQSSVPIASLTKMMTAYVVLKAHPLKPGEEGPSLTMTAQDVANYQSDLANGYSVMKVTEGESLTEKELLEGLLLPSGDNIASTLARWVSGSEEAFVAKMNETAKSLGMDHTHYADTSGVNPASVSNAADQIKIAQTAMKDPVFQEIVAMPQATIGSAGTVYNVNSMLGKHGVVGIKTGSMSKAGGNFVSATPVKVGNEKHFIIAAVLAQKSYRSLQTALDENVKILDEVRSQFKMYPLTEPAGGFVQVVSAWHSTSALKMTQPVQVFGYPGMKVELSLKDVKTELPLEGKKNVAALTIQAGQAMQTVPLQSTASIDKPSLLWRFLRN